MEIRFSRRLFVDKASRPHDNPGTPTTWSKQMIECAISTQMFSFRPLSAKHLEMFVEYGFERIELWAMRPHVDYLNPSYMRNLAGVVKKLGIRIVSFHAPFFWAYEKDSILGLSLGDPNPTWRRRFLDELKSIADMMEIFGAEALVVHGLGDSETREDPDHAKQLMRESVQELADYLEPLGVRIVVENILTHHSRTISLRRHLEMVHHEAAGICLDIGHANINENPEKAVENCGGRLFHLHFSDNHGIEDEHLAPYEGNINWTRVCQALKKSKNLRYATLEMRFDHTEDQVNMEAVRILLERARNGTAQFKKELEKAATQ